MSTDDGDELVEDLRQMVNNPELSDIIFICEDGVEVHACRMLVAARSLFFRQMLLNGMAESRESTVALPTIASFVLIIVLKFLYAGKLLDEDILHSSLLRSDSDGNATIVDTSGEDKRGTLRLNWDVLVKVVVAARFLMLARLETLILDKLRADLPEVGCHTEGTSNEIALRLSAICAYPKLWGGEGEVQCVDVIRYRFVQILMFCDLSVATLCNLSREAFICYLTEAQRASSDELKNWDWTLSEYLRLRHIILWCGITSCTSLSDCYSFSVDQSCLPGPEVATKFLEAWEHSTATQETLETTFDFSPGRKELMESISQEDLKPLLAMVDLDSIHPELLVAVIEPLHIIDDVDLTAALRVQAMRSSSLLRIIAKENVSNIWYLMDAGDELWRKPTNDKLTLSVSTRGESPWFKLTAVAGGQIGPCRSWEIVVTPHGSLARRDMAGFAFGFTREKRGQNLLETGWASSSSLTDHPISSFRICSDLRSACYHDNFDHDRVDRTYAPFHWQLDPGSQFKWNSPITVTVDRTGDCKFSCGGETKSFRPGGNLSSQRIYPAINFVVPASDQGRFRPHSDHLTVRIKFLD